RRFHDPTPVQHGYQARSSRVANPVFPAEFDGQPWDFEPKYALAASKRGSALHLSVTALSVKKALIGSSQVEKVTGTVMLHPHTRAKMHSLTAPRDCATPEGKGIVKKRACYPLCLP